MTFKLDENLGPSLAAPLRDAGYDVQTVIDERLGGASDQDVYEAVCREGRCLITLDLDFSDPIRLTPPPVAVLSF